MMKMLLSLMMFAVFSEGALLAEEKPEKPAVADKPKVEVYLIRKMEMKEKGEPTMEATILEISNPTDQTFYVRALQIESIQPETQVKRGDKWLVLPTEVCSTGYEFFPFKPGAKTLVTVDTNTPWKEEAVRFRFYFYTTDDFEKTKAVTATSREIERKEFSDVGPEVLKAAKDEAAKAGAEVKLEEPMSDEEMNKAEKQEGAKDPFGE